VRAKQHWNPPQGKSDFIASKPYRGKQLTVRMVSPDCSTGVPVSGVPYQLHSEYKRVKQPTPVTGNYLPAKFEVDNFDSKVSFTLTRVKDRHGKSSVVITELCCDHGVTAKLPLALFRQLGLRASTFLAFFLPPYFEFYDAPNVKVKTGKDCRLWIVGKGLIPAEVLNVLHDTEQTEADRLKRVWQLYKQAPKGQKYAKVAEGFGYPPGSKSGMDWAHKWVKRARKKFAPHTVRKAKQKRGKQ